MSGSTLSRQSSRDCCGSHIIRSRLMLSKPAARASPTAATARSAVMDASEPAQLGIPKRLDAEADAIDTGRPKTFHPLGGRRFGVGLEGDLRAAASVEGVATGGNQTGDLAGSRSDGVPPRRRWCRRPRPRAPAAANLRLERLDIALLQPGVEETAVEVAVVADGALQNGNVKIETEHGQNEENQMSKQQLAVSQPTEFSFFLHSSEARLGPRLASRANRARGAGRAARVDGAGRGWAPWTCAGRVLRCGLPSDFASTSSADRPPGIGRRMSEVRAVEFQEIAHLVQPRMDSEADPLLERTSAFRSAVASSGGS